jgi:hypothetical protein
MKMAIREKNNGLAYLRRSSDEQPNSLHTQLAWAQDAAAHEAVRLQADAGDFDRAVHNGLVSVNDLRLDNMTGADLNRPGFRALIRDAISDATISHVFIIRRDRFARPENPLEAMVIESQLTAAGITIVYSDRILQPSPSGETDLAESIMSLVDFHESGQFLKTHAERVLQTQRRLAQQGYWTGGRAPFGFERALLRPEGATELLAPGRRIRQEGCHVIIVPHHWEKIGTWLRILDWSAEGWGNKRIAKQLNNEGIPSPGAGRTRCDNGVQHRVSGKWHPNTVKSLTENRAILGILDYGRRSEGRHRRLADNGVRPLDDSDRRDNKTTKTIRNRPDQVISARLPHEPLCGEDKWNRVQHNQAKRGQNQRGVPRSRDIGRYPLSGRAIDLTDGCGHPLYGRRNGNRSVLVCGRYMKSDGGECNNNSVDSEAVLTFVLSTLRQIIAVHGDRSQIEQALRDRAQAVASSPSADAQLKAITSLEQSLADIESQVATAARRMVTVAEDLAEDASDALRALKGERTSIEHRLAEARRRAPSAPTDPDQEVVAAMQLLEQLELAMTDPPARRQLTALIRQLNLWLGLEFAEAIKGKKRRVRKLVRGVLTFDENDLPVPPYGGDNIPDDNTDHNQPEGAPGCSKSPPSEARNGDRKGIEYTDAAHIGVGGETECRQEGISFTKVIRGDWIRTSDLLTPSQAR